MTHERVVWSSWSRAAGRFHASGRRSLVHLREPFADRALCGAWIGALTEPREGDRDCGRCKRAAS